MDDSRRFRMLVSLSLADGKISEGEAALLSGWAKNFGLSPDRAKALVKEVREAPALEITGPQRDEEARSLFLGLLLMARRDGWISPEEASLLRVVGTACRFKEEDLADWVPEAGLARAPVAWTCRDGGGGRVRTVTLLADRFRVEEGEGAGAVEVTYAEVSGVRWLADGSHESCPLFLSGGRTLTLDNAQEGRFDRSGWLGVMRAVHEVLQPHRARISFHRRRRGAAFPVGWGIAVTDLIDWNSRAAVLWTIVSAAVAVFLSVVMVRSIRGATCDPASLVEGDGDSPWSGPPASPAAAEILNVVANATPPQVQRGERSGQTAGRALKE